MTSPMVLVAMVLINGSIPRPPCALLVVWFHAEEHRWPVERFLKVSDVRGGANRRTAGEQRRLVV